MPELGESVTEGTVTRWLKKVGDSVEVDEPLVEVSTDKVDTEIPSPVAGTLVSITAEEDDTVAVGGELAKIGDAGAAPAEEPAPKPSRNPNPSQKPSRRAQAGTETRTQARAGRRAQAGTQARTRTGAQARAAEAPSGDGGPYVTPLVRKLASENNIDLATVKGTGVGGRIRKQDVLAAAEAKKAPGRTGRGGGACGRGETGGRRPDAGACAGAPARHHPEGQPDPSDHREEDARIPAGHSAIDANPRGRHDQDRGAAGQGEEQVRRARRRQPDVSAVLRARGRSTR